MSVLKDPIVPQIRERAALLPIVQDTVQLRRSGKNYLGLCPFHSERTPSFTVSPDKQIFHCFGCGEGGDLFTFIMKSEQIDFQEALTFLANRLSIPYSPRRSHREGEGREEPPLLKLLASASIFFVDQLMDPEGKAARDYLTLRGLKPQTIAQFRIGFGGGRPDGLTQYLLEKGFSTALLEESGLAVRKRDALVDRLVGRLIFPIRDVSGKILGFGGRLLEEASEDSNAPKYLNSPEHTYYQKRRILYGLDLSGREIRLKKEALLVEGYFDVISCFQAGIRQGVAPLGTALTEEQGKMLKRFTDRVTLAFDSDTAGEKASERSIFLLRSLGFSVKVSPLPLGQDPDSMVRGGQSAQLQQQVEVDALPWFQYLVTRELQRVDLKNPAEKSRLVKYFLPLLTEVKNPVEKQEYLKLLAKSADIQLKGLEEELARFHLYTSKFPKKLGKNEKGSLEPPGSREERAERELLRLGLASGEIFLMIKEKMRGADFQHASLRKVFGYLEEREDFAQVKVEELLNENEDGDQHEAGVSRLVRELLLTETAEGNEVQVAQDCIRVIKAFHLREELKTIQRQLEQAEQKQAQDEVIQLHRAFSECFEQVRVVERG